MLLRSRVQLQPHPPPNPTLLQCFWGQKASNTPLCSPVNVVRNLSADIARMPAKASPASNSNSASPIFSDSSRSRRLFANLADMCVSCFSLQRVAASYSAQRSRPKLRIWPRAAIACAGGHKFVAWTCRKWREFEDESRGQGSGKTR